MQFSVIQLVKEHVQQGADKRAAGELEGARPASNQINRRQKPCYSKAFGNCILNSFKMLGGKRSQKSPARDFFDKLKRHASACLFLVGTPDWIRTSGLQSRSYQAVKPESPAAQGFGWCYTNFHHSEEKPRKPYRARLPRFFAVVVK